jgi:hypothetical protein
MAAINKMEEDLLKLQLSKQGYQAIGAIKPRARNSWLVEAHTLLPVSLNKTSPLFISVPVSLSVTLDDDNQINKIEEAAPSSQQVRDAEKFVETLIANNQLGGLPDQSPLNPTHIIEVNEKGQPVIKRRRFSSYG